MQTSPQTQSQLTEKARAEARAQKATASALGPRPQQQPSQQQRCLPCELLEALVLTLTDPTRCDKIKQAAELLRPSGGTAPWIALALMAAGFPVPPMTSDKEALQALLNTGWGLLPLCLHEPHVGDIYVIQEGTIIKEMGLIEKISISKQDEGEIISVITHLGKSRRSHNEITFLLRMIGTQYWPGRACTNCGS
jgi:hypothetical protein